ncbi:MarR family winged helix-turn-helix transcriptional regulator [Paenibacillus sepulcri]|uniref:MarR family transcriptional regulator n=1 Tax=Paenibacillus sepulcri TaxID=359917 RepID=A0ABS7BXR3_9BACL|nr:MarR family transcriptional regulator [Paenibacillus sepulcri]
MIDEEIRERLFKISAQMRRNFSELLNSVDLYVGQDQLLCQLWKEDGVTQVQLSESLNCEPPTVTNMINKLEKKGILLRKRDDADGRVSRVYVTPKGRELLEPVEKIWRQQTDKLLEGFSPEERITLKNMMQRMEKNLS